MDGLLELLSCAQREVVDVQRLASIGPSKDSAQRFAVALSLLQQASSQLYQLTARWDSYTSAHGEVALYNARRRSEVRHLLAYCFYKWMATAQHRVLATKFTETREIMSAANLVKVRCEQINSERSTQRFNTIQLFTQLSQIKTLSPFWRKWQSYAEGKNTKEIDFTICVDSKAQLRRAFNAWRLKYNRRQLIRQSNAIADYRTHETSNAVSLNELKAEVILLKRQIESVQRKSDLSHQSLQDVTQQLALAKHENRTLYSQLNVARLNAARTEEFFSRQIEAVSQLCNSRLQVFIESQQRDLMPFSFHAQAFYLRWQLWARERKTARKLEENRQEVIKNRLELIDCKNDSLLGLDSEVSSVHMKLRSAIGEAHHLREQLKQAMLPPSGSQLPPWPLPSNGLSDFSLATQCDEADERRRIESAYFSLSSRQWMQLAEVNNQNRNKMACIITSMRKDLMASNRACQNLKTRLLEGTARSYLVKWTHFVNMKRMKRVATSSMTSAVALKDDLRSLRALIKSQCIGQHTLLSRVTLSVVETVNRTAVQHHRSERYLQSVWFNFWLLNTQRRIRSGLQRRITSLEEHSRELEKVIAKALETRRHDHVAVFGSDMETPTRGGRISKSEDREANVCSEMLDFSREVNQNVAATTALIQNADAVVERVTNLSSASGGRTVVDDVNDIAAQLRELMIEAQFQSDPPRSEDF